MTAMKRTKNVFLKAWNQFVSSLFNFWTYIIESLDNRNSEDKIVMTCWYWPWLVGEAPHVASKVVTFVHASGIKQVKACCCTVHTCSSESAQWATTWRGVKIPQEYLTWICETRPSELEETDLAFSQHRRENAKSVVSLIAQSTQVYKSHAKPCGEVQNNPAKCNSSPRLY